MLALATGWTPDVLRDLPGQFRRACHWALYGRALADDGIPEIEMASVPREQKAEAAKAALHNAELRGLLFPEGD